MTGPCSVTAVIVNYYSADLTLNAVRSVQASAAPGPVGIMVLDNSRDPGEERRLRSGLPGNVRLLVNAENIGFGRACNQAFEQSEDPFLLLLNPDAVLLGDALGRLVEVMVRDQRIGAVSPQAFWDEECRFLLPPAHPPLLLLLPLPEAPGCGLAAALRLAGRFARRRSIRVWTAREPVLVSNLCGGHVLVRRSAVLRAGGLFDPQFFLYFEDADLFTRMRAAGSRLMIDPLARAVHHYDQCDRENWARKRTLMQEAHALYVRKHARKMHELASRLLGHWPRARTGARAMDCRAVDPGQELRVPEPLRDSWLFEWSPNPDFIPAAGCFGKGGTFRFPPENLEKLAPGRYFGRFGAREPFGRPGPALCWTIDEARRSG